MGAPGAGKGSGAPAAGPAASGKVRSPSGLEYEILKDGAGPVPPIGSKVKLHFTGWSPDGTVFLDTRATKVPKEFTLSTSDLIDGWVEALAAMKQGEVRKLYVPSKLAYGSKGYQGVVRPNADLVFELELVSFTPPPK